MVGQAETLRCALRVSPLRVLLIEGVVDTEEEGHSDPAGEPEGGEDAHALLVIDWEEVGDTEELPVKEPVIECVVEAEALVLTVKMEGVIIEDALGGAVGRAENVAVVEGEYVKSGARSRIPK